MKVTAITCTYQRPDALALCEKYLTRQTRAPDQWLILDGPEPMRDKVLKAIKDDDIEGDAIAFFEDDDLYRPDWLAWVEAGMKKGYDIIGEGNAVYYNVSYRWWSECMNKRHAALCQTAVSKDMLDTLANVIEAHESPFFDVRIWQVDCGKFLYLPKTPADRHVIGIKGIRSANGEMGYSGEHRDILPDGTHADPSMLELWKWAAEDAANYSRFWNAHTL